MSRILFFCVVAVATLWGEASVRASEIWRNDWLTSGAPALISYPTSQAAFDVAGDVIFGGETSWQENQFLRFDPVGVVRWTANLHGYIYNQFGVLSTTADGGAFIGFYGGPLVRVDASGYPLWSREFDVQSTARPAPDRIAVRSCATLTLLDASSGDVVWQHANAAGYCSQGVTADSEANLYTTLEVDSGATPGVAGSYRIEKLDSHGHVVWIGGSPITGSLSFFGIGNSLLYVADGNNLQAVRTSDGSVVWSMPFNASVLLSDDAEHEPIVFGSNSVKRLAATNGAVRWALPVSLDYWPVSMVGNALIARASDQLLKIDVATGMIAWSVPIAPLSNDVAKVLGAGGLVNGTFTLVFARIPVGGGQLMPALWRINFATGSIAEVSMPLVQQPVLASSKVADSSDVISVGSSRGSDFPMLNVRRLNRATGAVLWEVSKPIDDFGASGSLEAEPYPEMALARDAVAVAVTVYMDGLSYGAFRVELYDRSSGERRWHVWLNATYGAMSPNIAIDEDGNVLVSTGALTGCPPVGEAGCQTQSLYKLSAADGGVLWRVDDVRGTNASQIEPPNFVLVGKDVVIAQETVNTTPPSSVRRLSGIDGSIMWSINRFPLSPPTMLGNKIDDRHILLVNAAAVGELLPRASINLDTGIVEWTDSMPLFSDWWPCANYETILPNGDTLMGGTKDDAPVLRRIHNDGSGIIDEWSVGPRDPALLSCVTRSQLDSSGQLHLYVTRREPNWGTTAMFLTGFDMATGTVLGQQALYAKDDYSAVSYQTPLQLSATGALLADVAEGHEPAPVTMSVALFDTRATAHGNLAAEASVDSTHAVSGDNLGFHLRASYGGDQPIAAAKLVGNLPFHGGIKNLSCTAHGASNCVVDDRSGNVHASFDIEPGGSIDIAGQMMVLAATADPAMITAAVYGPIGLSEQNTLDNFARAPVSESLFANGFED